MWANKRERERGGTGELFLFFLRMEWNEQGTKEGREE
jgi:hypothetical protein